MTLPELEKILHALGTNILQAYICIETFKGLELPDRERYATVISMLCEMFAGLPRKIIEALDEINGIDGSEVKRDWGAPPQKAVVRRVDEEVVKIGRASGWERVGQEGEISWVGCSVHKK